MPFMLKDKSNLFGYDEQTSTFDAPVFEKDLGGQVMAEANRDGTMLQKIINNNYPILLYIEIPESYW